MNEKVAANLILIGLVWIGVFIYWAHYEIRYDRCFPWSAIKLFGSITAVILFLAWVFVF